MFCPLCRTEYRPGFTRCADCEVALVETSPEGSGGALTESDLEVAWCGGDPVADSRVRDALESAGIEFSEVATHDHMVFGAAMARPRYEIRVRRPDLDRAVEAIGDIGETLTWELSSKKLQEGELVSEDEDGEKPGS